MQQLTNEQFKQAVNLFDSLYKVITGTSFTDYIKQTLSAYPMLDADAVSGVMDSVSIVIVDAIQKQMQQTKDAFNDPSVINRIKESVTSTKPE